MMTFIGPTFVTSAVPKRRFALVDRLNDRCTSAGQSRTFSVDRA